MVKLHMRTDSTIVCEDFQRLLNDKIAEDFS